MKKLFLFPAFSLALVGQCICPIKLPIEVVGLDGISVTVPFDVAPTIDVTQPTTIALQIHNLKYQSEASLRVNNSAWLPLNDTTVTLLGLAKAYGGIGGGFSTLKLTMPIPGGSLVAGPNLIAFRFNGTDGRTSGFRILSFNIQDSSGVNLIAASRFTQDDPATWAAPLTSPVDIAAGKLLFQTANLRTQMTGPVIAIKAHCSDCHAQDGRDLKYFNFSNGSIRARSVFHGLTVQQGDQIASYIRSLSMPAPGRPWNPPYQPGPGLDSKPVEQWAAGAGLDAVLDSDAAMESFIAPGGSTAGWAATGYLNPREIPIALQLPDWNSWLPQVHPLDAFGSAFTASTCSQRYLDLRKGLKPSDRAAYQNGLNAILQWNLGCDSTYLIPIESTPASQWTSEMRSRVYSNAQWRMVKFWELNEEFGLEAMASVPFGSKANPRGWYGHGIFTTSPNMLHIPFGPGLGNGSDMSKIYLSFIWYQLQLVLNDGQGQTSANSPIDYPYVFGFIQQLSFDGVPNTARPASKATPEAMLLMEWTVKVLQEETASGRGPEFGVTGFQGHYTDPDLMTAHPQEPLWIATPQATRTKFAQAYLKAWTDQVSSFTPKQFYTSGEVSALDDPAKLNSQITFGGMVWHSLPRYRFLGVDPALVLRASSWAAKLWPKGNWAMNNSATCSSIDSCTSD